MLSSLCCSVDIMLYCYCVALLLFVLSCVLIVCTVPLPPGVNPTAVDKYIIVTRSQNPQIETKMIPGFHSSSVLMAMSGHCSTPFNLESILSPLISKLFYQCRRRVSHLRGDSGVGVGGGGKT